MRFKSGPQMFSEFTSSFPKEGNIIEVIEGPKRFSRVFIDDIGFLYQQSKKKKNGTLLLRCHTENCSATGIFNQETMSFHRLASHFHDPDSHSVLKLRFLQGIKLRAENESTKLSKIYNEEASKFCGVSLPPFDKIKSTLRKRRAASLIQNISLRPSSSLSNEKAIKERLLVATHYIARKGMEVIEGPKRFSKIYIDDHGFCYLINRKKDDGSLILRCHEDGCRGSGRYEPNESVFHKMAKHSHYADPLLVNKWRFLHQCKKRAENETISIKTIYDQESKRYPNCSLPSFKRIESTLQKRRKSKRLTDEIEYKNPLATDSIDSSRICEEEEEEETLVEEDLNPEVSSSNNLTLTCISFENSPKVSSHNIKKKFEPIIVRTCNNECDDTEDNSEERKLLSTSTSIRHISSSNITFEKLATFPNSEKKNTHKRKKMEVMEGIKRYSKIFLDESQHVYKLNKAKLDGVLILKCYERYCLGSGLYFPVEEIFQRSTEHNHEPSSQLVSKFRLLSSLKYRAETETNQLRVIYDEEVDKYPGVKIPSFRQLESTLQKRRRAKIPSEPSSLEEAALQFLRTSFVKSYRGNFFRSLLKVDDRYEIIVFISPGPLEEHFRKSKIFHIDTSFGVVPQGFSHIVILHLVQEQHIFPVVYALMNCKNMAASACYINLFEFLKQEFEDLDPHLISTDYEDDLEKAIQSSFPTAIVSGRWFHYTQVIWRHLRTCGLAQVFYQDHEAKLILKCAMALPLLPPKRIKDGLNFLVNKISNLEFHLSQTKNSLLKVTDFICDKWLQRLGPKRFSVFGHEIKINYDIEVLYRLFIKKLGIEPPTLIKFVEKVCQADSIILGEFNKKLFWNPIRADKSRIHNENEKLLKEISYKFNLGLFSIENFLVTASSTVPRHCLYSDLAFDPVEETNLYDPSDIPVSLPFCEINIVAPSEDHNLEPYNQTIPIENLKVSKETLIVDDIVVSSDHFQQGSTSQKKHSSLPQITQREVAVKKDFTFNVIWPSTLPSDTHLSKCSTNKNPPLLQLDKETESVIHEINVGFCDSVCLDRHS